jgi:hypothetical protein
MCDLVSCVVKCSVPLAQLAALHSSVDLSVVPRSQDLLMEYLLALGSL